MAEWLCLTTKQHMNATTGKTVQVTLLTSVIQDVYRAMAEMPGMSYGPEELRIAADRDVNYVTNRAVREGQGFLSGTMSLIGRTLDRALETEQVQWEDMQVQLVPHGEFVTPSERITSSAEALNIMRPQYFWPILSLVFTPSGCLRKDASPQAVKWIRQISYILYKYEVPIPHDKVEAVMQTFRENERELADIDSSLRTFAVRADQARESIARSREFPSCKNTRATLIAQALLSMVLRDFTVQACVPKHGPGAVAKPCHQWDKFDWDAVPDRTTDVFPLIDNYYMSTDDYISRGGPFLQTEESPARIIFVQKDSRGPRLISAEPKEYQFLQQGVMQQLVQIAETHWLTRDSVFFTNQKPNQFAALVGSDERWGPGEGYATLDLKEASDRVSMELVRLLFPHHVTEVLEAVRSLGTVYRGEYIPLRKHAPMGSAVCFPVMALSVWALTTACRLVQLIESSQILGLNWVRFLRSQRGRVFLEEVHVYGDDVIIPPASAETVIYTLECFGLKVNRHKSYTRGLFRESCGVDAFKGQNVTPVRLRTNWDMSSDQERYCSYIDLVNGLCNNGYLIAADRMAGILMARYQGIPVKSDLPFQGAPALHDRYTEYRNLRTRVNRRLQCLEIRVRAVVTPTVKVVKSGYIQLLRWFTEGQRGYVPPWDHTDRYGSNSEPFDTVRYTERNSSVLEWRWCTTARKC